MPITESNPLNEMENKKKPTELGEGKIFPAKSINQAYTIHLERKMKLEPSLHGKITSSK